MPAADDRGGSAGKGRRRRRRRAPAYKPPVRATDVKSDRERGRAESFKRTPTYRGAVRAAQDANRGGKRARTDRAVENLLRTRRRRPTRAGATPEERAERAKPTGRGLSPEDAVRLHAYFSRTDRNRELESSRLQRGGLNDADLRTAKNFRPLTDDIRREVRLSLGGERDRTDAQLERAASLGVKSVAPLLGILGKPGKDANRFLENVLLRQYQAARAIKESPGQVGSATAASILPTAKGAVAQLIDLVANPTTAPEVVSESLQQMAGEGEEARVDPRGFRERKKREGALTEVAETVGVLAPVAGVSTRLALATARADAQSRVGRATAQPKPGSRLHDLLVAPRPNLRTGSGPTQVREQRLAPTVARTLAQRVVDRRRASAFAAQQRAVEADPEGRTKIRGLIPGEGEVVRTSRGIGLIAQRRGSTKRVDEMAGRAHSRGQSLLGLNVRGARVRQGDERVKVGIRPERDAAVKGLSRKERHAFSNLESLALQGFVNFDSPKETLRALDEYEQVVRASRPADLKVSKKTDALRIINELRGFLDSPDAPKVLAAMRAFHEPQARRGERMREHDQTLDRITADVRRFGPMGHVLRAPEGKAAPTSLLVKDAANKSPEQVTWFHGTPAVYEGLPSAKGAQSDMGVYLTSDPSYAARYAAREWDDNAEGPEGARTIPVRVQPKKTLDMRAGKTDPPAMAAVSARVRSEAEKAATGDVYPATMFKAGGDYSRDLKAFEARMRKGEQLSLDEWETFVELLEMASSFVSTGRRGQTAQEGFDVLRTAITAEGFDSVRKVDAGADALVVLDESIMRPALAAPKGMPEETATFGMRLEQQLADIEARRKDPKDEDASDEWAALAVLGAQEKFVNDVRAAMRERGLADPVYVQHRKGMGWGEASAFTGGGNIGRTAPGHKKTGYVLFRQGRFDMSPEAYEAGIAASLKRQNNWNAVTDLREEFAVQRTNRKGEPTDRGSISDWQRYVEENNLDARDWRVHHTGVFRELRDAAEAEEWDRGGVEGDINSRDVHEAWKNATLTLEAAEAKFRGERRGVFQLLPAAATGRLEEMTQPSGAIGRTFDKIGFGAMSRLILNTSPTYIPVQVASQLLVGIPGTRGRLIFPLLKNAAGGVADTRLARMVLRRSLPNAGLIRNQDPETKIYMDGLLGVSHAQAVSTTTRYGSVAPGAFRVQKLGRAFQGFVDETVRRRVKEGKFNIFDWNRRMDEVQNAWFRQSAFEALLKTPHGKAVNRNVAEVIEGIDSIEKILRMPEGPQKVKAIRANEKQFEAIADKVNELLGNWTTFSPFERRVMRRMFLFYGFLRYATKFTLYTMPVKHPTTTALLATLGAMENDEIVDLLALQLEKDSKGQYKREEIELAIRKDLLAQIGGRIYWANEDGDLRFFDTGKINPVTGPVVEFFGAPAKTIGGLMNPLMQSVVNIWMGERGATKAQLHVEGMVTDYGRNPEMNVGRAARIIIRDLARASPGIRAIDEALSDPSKVQGDDSLPLFNDRPLLPRTANEARKLAEKAGRKPTDPLQRALKTTVPLISPPKDRETIERVKDATDFGQLDDLQRQMDRIKQSYLRRMPNKVAAEEAAKRDRRFRELKEKADRIRDRQPRAKRPRRQRQQSGYGGGSSYGSGYGGRGGGYGR